MNKLDLNNKINTVIILINYNSLVDTLECIESIKNSKNYFGLIVIVDNASGNQNEVISTFDGTKDIHLITSSTNIGFGRANNLAISWVRTNIDCKYIFLLNNDTIIEPGTLNYLRTSFEAADELSIMVTPKILIYSNPNEIWYGGAKINYNKLTPIIEHLDDRQYVDFASGCCMFFRSQELYELSGFDPFFFMYDEDVELSMRINASGKKILYEPNAVVLHKCQGSQTKSLDIPSNQLDPRHPSLLFYLGNTIVNRRYIIKNTLKHQRLKAKITHTIYWLLKALQYLFSAKFKATYAVIVCLIVKIPIKMPLPKL